MCFDFKDNCKMNIFESQCYKPLHHLQSCSKVSEYKPWINDRWPW